MLPQHLRRYVVEQDYSRYTPIDQEVWRYVMRQLRAFLSVHGHPCYIEGLGKTGIETDNIPEISKMSEKLEKFGWHAIPVSGFIPPAAFMELQAHGYLPIASDMRTIDHLTYTPAPDIVHEAAGHAPILIEPEFAAYLKQYAQVASKAIISHEDMEQYEAIRVLSDLKEDPNSTPEEIRAAEKKLEEVCKSISHVSEAALLGRMNWWTAEYGLIGSLENPRIFGAGLLSSVGEARDCLSDKVKKIPLTIECIDYSYDITEPQPQLFVAPNFSRLGEVLEQLAERMAFRHGGAEGLEKAKLSKTVNTVELDSGLQISGRLKDFIRDTESGPAYVQFDGPTQLSFAGKVLPGHGRDYHAQGFGSPVGDLEGSTQPLSKMKPSELEKFGIKSGSSTRLKFKSGVVVSGRVKNVMRSPEQNLLVIAFEDCTVDLDGKILFDPAWGIFDMAVGSRVTSVFGGPADRLAYGETSDFAAKRIPKKEWSEKQKAHHALYQELREVRTQLQSRTLEAKDASTRLSAVAEKLSKDFPNDWLLRLDLLELEGALGHPAWLEKVEIELEALAIKDEKVKSLVEAGTKVFH